MSQVVSLRIRGLVTNENEMIAEEGALLTADDVVIDKESIAELRRGFKPVSSSLADICKRLMVYQGSLVAVVGNHLTVLKDSWISLKGELTGTLRSAQAHSNLYITTSRGVMKLDSLSSDPILAGVPKALDITAKATDVGGFLPKGSQVAYRVVWGYTDANKNLCLGTPSQRCVVINQLQDIGDRKVQLQFPIPSGITEKHFFQVYRSESAQDASDELALSFEQFPTADQLKSKKVIVTDLTPRSLLGASLYTNATQEGILQGNDEPPIAHDLALFRDCMFYCNTAGLHRLFLTLKVIGRGGLSVGDVITIAGTSYRAATSENSDKNEFALSTDSSSLAMSQTIASLVRVVNRSDSGVYVYSFDTSDDPDDLGKMLIQSRIPFRVETSAHPTAFGPVLPQSSANDVNRNAVYFSKYRQYESVPLLNSFLCGADNQAVYRLIPLRDGLFALAEGGAYRISGWSPESFYREVFDSTVKLMAPESPAVLSNHIFCLTNQGVVAINDTGVTPISRTIENQILFLLSPDMAETTKRVAFGIGYESDRKYILFAPSHPEDTYATQAFVYNIYTRAWTHWNLSATCGLIHPLENKIYLVNTKAVLVERKSGLASDYIDEEGHLIEGRLEWVPQSAGNPFVLKQWSECSISFRKKDFARVDFRTELSQSPEGVEFRGDQRYCRTYVPAQKQLAALQYVGLTCRGPFELEGLSLSVNGSTSERISR